MFMKFLNSIVWILIFGTQILKSQINLNFRILEKLKFFIALQIKNKEPENKGFIIAEHQDKENKYLKGKVISKGELVEGINEDDIVWYSRHTGHAIEFNNNLYYVIKYGDIVIVE